MPRGRPAKNPRREIIWRADETVLMELYSLNPSLLDAQAQARYGAMQNYLTSLVTQDLEKRRSLLRKQAANG